MINYLMNMYISVGIKMVIYSYTISLNVCFFFKCEAYIFLQCSDVLSRLKLQIINQLNFNILSSDLITIHMLL